MSLCACGCGKETNIAKKTSKRRGVKKGEPYKFLQGHYIKLNPPEKGSRPDVSERNRKRRIEKTSERNYCQCGCGQKVKTIGSNFVPGHYWRNRKKSESQVEKQRSIMSEKRKDPNSIYNSEKYREKLSEACAREKNGFFGRHHSEETLGKQSKAKEGKYCGKNNPMFGVYLYGENNGNWNGGSSFEPYAPEFNKELKNKIREKFNHTCVLCGKFAKIPHHIDYNKKNNTEENFVLLCSRCNSKVNANRQFWETQFKIINGVFDSRFLGGLENGI